MSTEISLAQADLEDVIITLGNLRGLLNMLQHSSQTTDKIRGEDLEGTVVSIDYIVGEVEDNIENVVRRMGEWENTELRKGA
ncbi:MAG: hypothetical protein HDT20_04225 [Oscillibacter sp.]|nr:hypothetical protein [Oscillibacter sp.]